MAVDSLIRVMIVDDNRIIRSGIRFSLLAFHDLELVSEAENGKEALAVCAQMRDSQAMPDVILVDTLMPEMDGVATMRAILERHPEAQVIALTSFDTGAWVQGALQAGAIGCLPKDATIDELAEAIRAAHAGRATLAPVAAQALAEASPEPPGS